MASMAGVLSEVGRRLGLASQPNPSNVIGELDGYQVQLTAAKVEGTDAIVARIRHGSPDAEDVVREGLAGADTASVGIKPKDVKVDGGMVMYTQKRSFARALNVDSVANAFELLFAAVKSSSQPSANACRMCGGADIAGPRLLNGVVDRVCDSCIAKLHAAVDEARAAYDAIPTNVLFATIAAAILAIVGAVVWAGIGVATGRMYWIVAIGVGLLIGFGVTKTARKRSAVTQTLCIAFTLLSVLFGQLMWIGYHVVQQAGEEGVSVHWGKFLLAAPAILIDTGSDTVFALGGGLMGAFYAARMAGRPKMDVRVEG